MQKDTVSMYFVRAAIARLQPDAKSRVLARAAVSPELLPAVHARVPAAAFATLWLAVAVELDDEFFGLDRRRMKVGSFALLCHAVLHSTNLEQATRGILRGFGVLLDDVTAALEVDGDKAAIVIDNRIAAPEARRFADETFLIMVHGLMCWLAGKRIALDVAAFSGPRPPYPREYGVMFSPHLQFDAVATSIRFDARLLDAPVIQNAATLKTFLRTAPQSVFLKYRNTSSWSARLRRRLRSSLGGHDWPLLEDIAREFDVAPTTLRRRLDAEGTSYHTVRDELRRDVAIHALGSTPQSVAEVAALVCFQEVSAFRRAFKKWTGVSPSHYRSAPP